MTDSVPTNYDLSAASSGTPLDAVVFDRLMMSFAPFEAAPKMVVGVSGGADSMALALLAHQWCQARGGAVVALTVDHGLRSGSAAEARWVGDQLSRYGIEHVILRWEGTKPASAVQERARQARYDLIDRFMADRGIFHLLVAHHGGDQAETIAMRDARGAGIMGQAGMSARRFLRNGRVLRPLLSVPKTDLIATLRQSGQEWVEDPSNCNEKFERVRVRSELQTQGAGLVSFDDASERIRFEAAIGRLLAQAVTLHGNGVVQCARDLLTDTQIPEAVRVYALGQVVRTVGGAAYMPAIDGLAAALARLASAPSARVSLGGCVLHGRKGKICVYRELGRMDREPVRVARDIVGRDSFIRWDNRFELVFDRQTLTPQDHMWIAPLDRCDVCHTKAFRAALREIVPFIGDLPRAALASMPALYDKEGLRSVGGLEVSELSDVLSAADCEWPPGRGKFSFGGRWRFAPPVPLWESGFKSSPKPGNLLA